MPRTCRYLCTCIDLTSIMYLFYIVLMLVHTIVCILAIQHLYLLCPTAVISHCVCLYLSIQPSPMISLYLHLSQSLSQSPLAMHLSNTVSIKISLSLLIRISPSIDMCLSVNPSPLYIPLSLPPH